MLHYKTVGGRRLHTRTLPSQRTKAKVECNVLNRMTGLHPAPLTRKPTRAKTQPPVYSRIKRAPNAFHYPAPLAAAVYPHQAQSNSESWRGC